MKGARLRLSDLPLEKRKELQAQKRAITEAQHTAFARYCLRAGLPAPVAEYRFHPVRRWRFDYAFRLEKVALEVEGGAFTEGRHTRGSGFVGDLDKYSEAAACGWKIVRVTPEDLYEPRTIEWLRRAMES